ncbi:MAG: hypothetical protein LUD50_03955, partial [Clostridia bacterium]|nr:hypothetical protein [Clostridia bacterium]
DVWYGFRKTEFTGSDQSRLNGYVSSAQEALEILKHAYDSVAVLGADQMGRIISDLKALPISSVQAVSDRMLTGDLEALFNGNLKQQIKVITAEKERSKNYALAAERYFAITEDLPDVDTRKIRAKLSNAGDYADRRLSGINEELDRVRVVSDTLGHITGKQSERIDKLSIKELHELIESIETITENDARAEKLEKEIGRCYDDSVFDYDYTKLLTKLRTKWRLNVERRREPIGFKGAVKELMKRCRDTSIDFTINYVYDLVSKLDAIKQIDESAKVIRTRLADYGLDGDDITVHVLSFFNEFLKQFLALREDFAVQNLLGGAKNGFRRFISDRMTDLKNIADAVEAFGIAKDITVAEFIKLPDDYDTVSLETKRLDGDKNIRAILPSLYNGCRTSWDEILGILNIVQDVLSVLGAGKDTKAQRELFTKIASCLADAGFAAKADRLLSVYSKFYGDTIWFAPGDTDTERNPSALTYDACAEWLNQIKDTDHIEQYVSYRNLTKEMEGKTEGAFYTEYMKRSRKDYPIDRIAAGYRISVLWAYYELLAGEGRMVSKLAQGTALEDMIQSFSEADKDMHDFSRKAVDMQLAAGISHNSTLHSYLETQTQDKNYSVR